MVHLWSSVCDGLPSWVARSLRAEAGHAWPLGYGDRTASEGSEFGKSCGLVFQCSISVGGFFFDQDLIFRREERGSEPLGEHRQRAKLRWLKLQQDHNSSFAFQPETKPCKMGRRVWKRTTSFRLTCEASDRRAGSPHAQEGRQRARKAGRSCPSRPWKSKADSEGAPRSFTNAMLVGMPSQA